MRKLSLVFAATALMTLCGATYASHAVSCMQYLNSSPYALSVDQKNRLEYFIVRHQQQNFSNETYIKPDGSVEYGQVRSMQNGKMCAGYIKQHGQYVQQKTFSVYRKKAGFIVKAIYMNGAKRVFHVFPISKNQMKIAAKM
ncbi:MAG: hypothetical protein ACD_29C00043G0002 [uncultured bacterium]|nr:MAG: hypothetical protein ACD_29C00043G0002 [uncultured bacterium]